MAPRTQPAWLVVLVLTLACDDSECLWELDELLAEADVGDAERTSCGSFNGAQREEVADALDCLLSTPEGKTAELTVNDCIDCFIESTYVITGDQRLIKVKREADELGDDVQEVTVSRCDTLRITDNGLIQCVTPAQAYACDEPLR
jgi:hypothetical protein